MPFTHLEPRTTRGRSGRCALARFSPGRVVAVPVASAILLIRRRSPGTQSARQDKAAIPSPTRHSAVRLPGAHTAHSAAQAVMIVLAYARSSAGRLARTWCSATRYVLAGVAHALVLWTRDKS